MKILGERVVLRPVQPSDFTHIVSWTNDEQVGHFAEDDGYPERIEQCEQWYQRLLANRHNQVYVIVVEDVPIGDVELDHITWRSGDAELKIRIGNPQFWNQGYGTDAVKSLLGYAFEQMNLRRVYLRVSKENPRAIRCYEKAFFRKEGKLVRQIEAGRPEEIVYLMRVLKEDYVARMKKQSKALEQVG